MPATRLADLALSLRLSVSTVSRAFREVPGIAPKTKARILAEARRLGFTPDVFAQSLKRRGGLRRVTLEDVARAAGCSKMAVSLALRNQPGIAPKTAALIRKAAKKLGYVPSPEGAILAARRRIRHRPSSHSVIGVVVGHRDFNPLRSPLPQDRLMHQHLRRRAEELGLSIDFFWLHDPEIGRRLPDILRARSIQGLILHSLDSVDFDLFRPAWDQFSVVQLSTHPEEAQFHYTFTNLYPAIWRVSHYVCQLGYRRPALVIRPGPNQAHSMCLSAAIREASLPFQVTLAYHEWPASASRHESTLAFLDEYKPDVVYTYQDQLAQWLKAHRNGVRPFGLVDIQVNPFSSKTSGLVWNLVDIAAASVNLLFDQLGRNERGRPAQPQGIFLPLSWQQGETLERSGGGAGSPVPPPLAPAPRGE